MKWKLLANTELPALQRTDAGGQVFRGLRSARETDSGAVS